MRFLPRLPSALLPDAARLAALLRLLPGPQAEAFSARQTALAFTTGTQQDRGYWIAVRRTLMTTRLGLSAPLTLGA